jgi:GNAT superfamily N-acetyltransferase
MITIRKAIKSDAGKIIAFQKSMAWETEKITLPGDKIRDGINAVFEDPLKGQYWVAEMEGEVVASLLITFEWSDWRNTYVWWFQSVYVMPQYRQKGIFRSMYSFIRDEAVTHDIAGLRLYVESNNIPARKTYEAVGMSYEHYTMYEWLR